MPPAKLNHLQKADYVRKLRAGGLRYESAEELGLLAEQIRVAVRDDSDFRAACQDAVLAANEPVESALYKAAIAGEPWAVTFYLKHRDRERWGEQTKEVRVIHELDGAELLKTAAEIGQQLQRRRALAEGTIDVEEVKEQDANYYEHGEAPYFPNPALHKTKHYDIGGEG